MDDDEVSNIGRSIKVSEVPSSAKYATINMLSDFIKLLTHAVSEKLFWCYDDEHLYILIQ
jgi:hypothetical protein